VVGSGPAGALLALELAERGVRTLLLEGGAASVRHDSPEDEDFPVSRVAPIPYPVDSTRFLGDGGTSNLWSARCPRFQPFDFDPANPYVPAEAPWPITYADIEPYYDRAERQLAVAGGPGSRYSPPRSRPLPSDAERAAGCLEGLLGEAGWATEMAPVSHAARIARTHLPRFVDTPSGQFVRNTRVVEILSDPGGRISGLRARAGTETTIVRARYYVLACGGIETPALLLRSRTHEFPNGIGNTSDQVGRHFMEHLGIEVGTIHLASAPACLPSTYQDAISWQLYEEFKQSGLGAAIFEFGLLAPEPAIRISAVLEMTPQSDNRVLLAPGGGEAAGQAASLTLSLTDRDRSTWRRAKAVGPRLAASLKSAKFMEGPVNGGWCHHHMGACRMGRDAKTSVVDPDLKVHGTENLFVAGSAAFVTGGVGSPTLLLTALSIRLADHLASKLGVTPATSGRG
jgi:choline dehydrogenase-like flavoprotein